jgi:hypothetical protein
MAVTSQSLPIENGEQMSIDQGEGHTLSCKVIVPVRSSIFPCCQSGTKIHTIEIGEEDALWHRLQRLWVRHLDTYYRFSAILEGLRGQATPEFARSFQPSLQHRGLSQAWWWGTLICQYARAKE